MQYTEAKQGRVFILRLEHNEILHETLEEFAKEHGIKSAAVTVVGGVNQDSTLVVGPANTATLPPNPMQHTLTEAHEVAGTGTIFPNDQGDPVLHMHIAAGREQSTITGCVRSGVKIWHILEVVIIELITDKAIRKADPDLGFALLTID